MFQFRGLCLCFIYFCLCFFSLQTFLPCLHAQMFYHALQLSLCQKSAWHLGSLTPRVTIGSRSLFSGIRSTGIGHNVTPASSRLGEHARETADTQELRQRWYRHRIRVPNHSEAEVPPEADTCAKPSQHLTLQGNGAFIWVCLFYPSTTPVFFSTWNLYGTPS